MVMSDILLQHVEHHRRRYPGIILFVDYLEFRTSINMYFCLSESSFLYSVGFSSILLAYYQIPFLSLLYM